MAIPDGPKSGQTTQPSSTPANNVAFFVLITPTLMNHLSLINGALRRWCELTEVVGEDNMTDCE